MGQVPRYLAPALGVRGEVYVERWSCIRTSESPENDSTIARVPSFPGKEVSRFHQPSKAQETPSPTKVKSLSLEIGTCRDVWGLGQLFLGLRKGDLSMGLGVIFWEPLKLLTKGYGLFHLSWEGSEISLQSRRLKDAKKVKNRCLRVSGFIFFCLRKHDIFQYQT